MTLRIQGDTGGFAKMHVGGKLKKIRNGIELDFRGRFLRECVRAEQYE
jgi:hypothetical protein